METQEGQSRDTRRAMTLSEGDAERTRPGNTNTQWSRHDGEGRNWMRLMPRFLSTQLCKLSGCRWDGTRQVISVRMHIQVCLCLL